MCSLLNHFTCTIDAVTKNGNPKFIHLLRQRNAKIQFQWTWNIQSNSWYWISSGCYNITFILSYIIKFLKESPMWSLWHHNEPIIWLIRKNFNQNQLANTHHYICPCNWDRMNIEIVRKKKMIGNICAKLWSTNLVSECFMINHQSYISPKWSKMISNHYRSIILLWVFEQICSAIW